MTQLTVQEILQDLIICEKFMATMYKQFTLEVSNMDLQKLCLNNMEEIFETQHQIFLQMKERDLYPVEIAPMKKIDTTIKTVKDNSKYYDESFED